MHRSTLLVMLALAGCSPSPQTAGPGPDGQTPGEVEPVDRPDDVPDGASEGVRDTPGLRPAIPLMGDRTSSAPMVLGALDHEAFAVDPDRGSVVSLRTDTGVTHELAVGDEPSHLVRVGADLFVTLRATGDLVRLHVEDDGTLTETDRVPVGAEPVGLAVSFQHDRLFVALSQDHAVVALDATTLEEIGRWQVPGEPKWVVAMPYVLGEQERIFVVSARQPLVTEIRTSDGMQRATTLPQAKRFNHPNCPDRTLSSRASGDPGIGPDGYLYVPALYADVQLFDDPEEPLLGSAGTSDDDGADTAGGIDTGTTPRCPQDGDAPNRPGVNSYGQTPPASDVTSPGVPSRLTPMLVQIDPAPGNALTGVPITLGTHIVPFESSGSTDDNGDGLLDVPRTDSVRAYPSSVTFSVRGQTSLAWLTIPNQGAVVVLDLHRLNIDEDVRGLQNRVRMALPMRHGARVLHLRPSGEAVSWSPLTRDVEVHDAEAAAELFADGAPAVLTPQPNWHVTTLPLLPSPLSDDLLLGRTLFHAANDPRVAAHGSGISCESCHVDGRTDGFTWVFEDMPRQTMNLAGRVSDTLPITWLGNVPAVVDEVMATSTLRMGGSGLGLLDAGKVAAYIDSTREVTRPQVVDADAVERGEAIFVREDVGCALCHTGEAGTDGQLWRVAGFDRPTNTPTLRGIASSAPYFHDGSAATLADVLARGADGSMGRTDQLSAEELADLEAYLRTR